MKAWFTKVLRCQYRGGRRNNLEGLLSSSTVADLLEKIWLMTEVPPHAQRSTYVCIAVFWKWNCLTVIIIQVVLAVYTFFNISNIDENNSFSFRNHYNDISHQNLSNFWTSFLTVLSGFPPKQLQWKTKDDLLSSVDIRSGDTLIIEEDKCAPRVLVDSYKKSLCGAALGKITRK